MAEIWAEFYMSTEVSRRSTLRRYARPLEEQRAREHMYDPVRRSIAEYFRSSRDPQVIHRIAAVAQQRHFNNPEYEETWRQRRAYIGLYVV